MRKRMTQRAVCIALIASAALGIGGALNAAAPAEKIALSAHDKKLMTAASCAGAGLDSVVARKESSRTFASVRCESHGKEGETPVARAAQCEKNGGAWTCAPARDALMMKLSDDSVLALISIGVRAPEAIQTLNSVANMSVPPFQNGAIDVLQDQCSIRQLPERAFKGATHFSVECTRGTLAVTRDCWDGRCRFFITHAMRRN
jgi:hypothetical protein